MHISGELPAHTHTHTLRVAKPEDADKAYRPAVQIASHKTSFCFPLEREPSSVNSSVLAASKSQSLEPLPRSR